MAPPTESAMAGATQPPRLKNDGVTSRKADWVTASATHSRIGGRRQAANRTPARIRSTIARGRRALGPDEHA
jgi:hypothetical protein